jgi:G3E family GTPase
LTQVPVTIITGFLGSGKTTLLKHLLQQPALADSAVIINEFGDVGIDHLLVAAPSENLVLLDTGCICCRVRGELVQTLTELHTRRADGSIPTFRNLIIETSGLADPVPLLQTIVADEVLRHAYRLHHVVALVDAVHGESQLDTHEESLKQAALADTLLVTKTDVAERVAVDSLHARLARLNPGAELHEVVRGRIDPAVFMSGARDQPRRQAADIDRWLNETEHAHAGHPHSGNRHDTRIRSFCLYHERPIRRAGLMMWLDMLTSLRGSKLLRAKGLLNVEGDPVVVHVVQTIIHEPAVLKSWPTEDRRSRLVFITRDIERHEIERTLAAFDYAPPSMGSKALDPRAYARFVEAVNSFRSERRS